MSASRTAKRYMNLMSVIVFVPCLLLVSGNTVFAEPYLMLDAKMPDGSPPPSSDPEEGIFTSGPVFTLYALVNSEAPGADLGDTFYISVAIIPSRPETFPDPELGSYFLDYGTYGADGGDTTIDVVGEMDYGTPPIDAALNPDELAAHGIFDTYFKEYAFTLDPGNTATLYNSMDYPGGPGPDPGSLYYQAFEVDASGLESGNFLHFDLYTKIDGSPDLPVIDKFAPFSHDVTHTPVPGAVLLGILGLGVAGLKLRKYA